MSTGAGSGAGAGAMRKLAISPRPGSPARPDSPAPGTKKRRMRTAARRGSVSLSHMSLAGKAKILAQRAKRAVAEFHEDDTGAPWHWVADPRDAYVPARVPPGQTPRKKDGKIEVLVGTKGEARMVTQDDVKWPIMHVQSLNKPVEDMVKMDEVNEATILENLRARFKLDEIYTNIGTILVSINPFKWMDHLYTKEYVDEQLKLGAGEEATPHVFTIANASYQGLRNERVDQSIIISGESGAGKTEATKKCLQFFAEAAGSNSGGMEKRLLSANPILEAFGNAKTVRNNNSSRFGKWMVVHFDGRAQICGSQIVNYLLEKSRVVSQNHNERNYHVFYNLCKGGSKELLESLGVRDVSTYNYTRQCAEVEGMDDRDDYKLLLMAMDQLSFEKKDIDPLFKVVAGIMWLGNVEFEEVEGDKARVKDCESKDDPVLMTARNLQLDPEKLRTSLVTKVLPSRDRVVTNLTVERATDARNSLAKSVYGRMFDWLVKRVNRAMEGASRTSRNVIGVLDIFGFEIFELNSFEQLCINYCNEKLQQHFNTFVFKAEEKCYQSEGIDYAEVKFVDNQDVLDLIEKRPRGLLVMLDDEIKVPKGSDSGYLRKVNKAHIDNPRFRHKTKHRSLRIKENEFGVRHYAGVVVYDTVGWLEKNKDELLLNLRELLISSTLPFISDVLFENDKKGYLAGNLGNMKQKSQSGQFRQQLDSLMTTLFQTQPQYIRCVKPNQLKVKELFDAPICLQQLRYAGVFEAVKIRQQGFPFRWTHQVFYTRYRILGGPEHTGKVSLSREWKDMCGDLLDVLKESHPVLEQCKFGRTMVLYRAEPHRKLESLRERRRIFAARVLQRCTRGFFGRKFARSTRRRRDAVRAAMASRQLEALKSAVEAAEAHRFVVHDVKAARVFLDRLLEEKECRERLAALLPEDPVDNFDDYQTLIERAVALDFRVHGDETLVRVEEKFATVEDRRTARRVLAEGMEAGDRVLIEEATTIHASIKERGLGDTLTPRALEQAAEALVLIAKEDKVLRQVRAGMAQGGPKGAVGALDAQYVLIKPLEEAIRQAEEQTIRTRNGMRVMESARMILDLRRALVGGQYAALEQGVDDIMKALHANRLAREASSEIQVYVDEVQNQHLLQALDQGLRVGRATGLVGNLDFDSLSTRDLNKAIDLGEEVGWKSARATELHRVAKAVLELRTAMIDNQWREVEGVLNQLREIGREVELPEATAAELALAQDELNNQRILLELQEALETGAATGEPGEFDSTTVMVHDLSKRLGNALKDGAKTERARQLVDLARVTLALRQCLLEDRWDEVESILAEATQLPTTYSRASAVEFKLVQWEVDDRNMVKALSEAIEGGALQGVIGQPDLTSISIEALAAVRAKAKRVVCRSSRALWLLEIANCLYDIRTALLQEQWTALPRLLAACRALDGNAPAKLAASLPPPADDGAHTPGPPPEDLPAPPPPIGPPPMIPGNIMPPPEPMGNGGPPPGPPPSFSDDMPPPASPDAPPPPPDAGDAGAGAGAGAGASAPPAPRAFDPEYMLPRSVKTELLTVQDQLDHRTIMLGLTAGLGEGRVTGEVGALNRDHVSVTALAAAIRSAESIGPKAGQAKQLLRTCLTVQTIRQAVLDDDWFKVQSLLNDNGIPCGRAGGIAAAGSRKASGAGAGAGAGAGRTQTAAAHAGLAVPMAFRKRAFEALPHVEAEMELLAGEVNNQTIVQRLTAVLRTGAATGVVGDLDLSTLDVNTPAEELRMAKEMGMHTDRARMLFAVTEALLGLRKTLVQENWDSVARLIARVRDAMGDDAPGSDSEDESPALALSPRPQRTRELTPLECVAKEVALVEDELENRVALTRLREALTTGNPTGKPGDMKVDNVSTLTLAGALMAVNKKGVKTDLAHQLLVSADMIMRVRTALLAGDWDKMEVLFQEVRRSEASAASQGKNGWAASEAKAELALVEAEMNNRTIVHDLTTALCSGSATGRIGELDVSGIDLTAIDAGIATAQRLGCHTEEAVLLLESAKMVRRLREALLTNNHQRLASVLGDANGLLLSDLTAAEFDTARAEIANRDILRELSAALSRGMPAGAVGHMSLSKVTTTGLRKALAFASRLGAKTQEARQMVFTAKVVLRVRQALLRGDYEEAHRTLDSVRGKTLSAVSMHEVMAEQDEVENWVLTKALTAALRTGRATGSTGDLDVGDVDVLGLRRALVTAEEVGAKTSDARALVLAGKQILKLRLALVEADWEAVDEVLEQSRDLVMSDIALEELQAAQEESDNRRIVSTITAALMHGGPRGRIGEVDTKCVHTGTLDQAIALAMELGCVTEQAERLLATAKLVRRVRSVLQGGNWEFVEQVIREPRDFVHESAGKEELAFVQREVDNRRSVSMLTSGLLTGQCTGRVGHVQKDSIDCEVLDAAIEFTEKAGCHTAEVAELYDTARMMAALRRAVLSDDMQAGRKILQQHKSVAAVARPELAIIQQEVAAWQVTESLNAAISGGMATGDIGELDTSSPQVEILDASIATARNLGCHTRAAQRCLLSAMIIRRVRGGLLKNDWQFVSEVLEQANEQAKDIVDAARPELDAARNELKFRRCMALLKHAVGERDEKALLEGIGIAEDLGLANHRLPEVGKLVQEATLVLGKIERCKAALAQAMANVEEELLADALALCDDTGYSSLQVDQARDLLTLIRDLTERATWAIKRMDRPEMERVLAECQRVNLHIPDVAHIIMALRLPADEFLQRQLGAAVALRDADRVTDITMQIKSMFFEDCADLFQLHKFPNLKAPREFSKRYGVADNGLRSSMLRFTNDTIPQSLTRLQDSTVRRRAVRCFRCITGFMGDRECPTPLSLAQQLLQEGLMHPALRDEILIQLTKQLNCNPTPNSVDRGWVLLELALSTFPPSEDLENYLEVWLRDRHATPCVRAMHKSIFEGPKPAVPTLADIEAFVTNVIVRLHNPIEAEASGEDDDVSVPHIAEVEGVDAELGDDGLPLAYSGLGDGDGDYSSARNRALLGDGWANGGADVEYKSGEREGRGGRSKRGLGSSSGEDEPHGGGGGSAGGGGGGYAHRNAYGQEDGSLPPPPPPQHTSPPPPPPPKAGGAGYGAGAGATQLGRADVPPPPPDA